jgi:hypothetical protein
MPTALVIISCSMLEDGGLLFALTARLTIPQVHLEVIHIHHQTMLSEKVYRKKLYCIGELLQF